VDEALVNGADGVLDGEPPLQATSALARLNAATVTTTFFTTQG
jgi:hypothetical protein